MSVPFLATAIEVPLFDREFLWHFRAKWLPAAYMDGDTFTALADTGYSGRHEVSIRLEGIFEPERNEPGGPEATRRLFVALSRGQGIADWDLRIVSKQRIHVVVETKTFERYVATVYVVMGAQAYDVRGLL